MKKFIIVFILIIISKVKLFSQDSLSGSNDYKSVLQISCLNLIIKDITVDYSYFISKKHYIEISLGYRFNSENADYKIGFIKFEDPFWLYNQISTRIGFGNYFSESFYITPMVLFNYSYFDRKYFNVYEDYEGDLYDKDYVLSRNKKSFGAMVKVGYTYSYKKLRIDPYFGIGYSCIFKNETVYEKLNWRKELIPDNYPIKNKSIKSIPTIHLGVLFGLKFK